MIKKKLVIYSGTNNLSNDSSLEKNLVDIGNKLNSNKFEIWCKGEESENLCIISQKFKNNDGEVFTIKSKKEPDFESIGEFFLMDSPSNCENLADIGDIFLYIPGGIGTISNLFEVISNVENNIKNVIIILYSHNDFYKETLSSLIEYVKFGFISQEIINSICFFNEHQDIINFLNDL